MGQFGLSNKFEFLIGNDYSNRCSKFVVNSFKEKTVI